MSVTMATPTPVTLTALANEIIGAVLEAHRLVCGRSGFASAQIVREVLTHPELAAHITRGNEDLVGFYVRERVADRLGATDSYGLRYYFCLELSKRPPFYVPADALSLPEVLVIIEQKEREGVRAAACLARMCKVRDVLLACPANTSLGMVREQVNKRLAS